jgi:hypothetical protein
MDPKPIAEELRAIDGRGPCTDAERRATRAIARRLRDLGRRPRTQTVWVRPDNDELLALASGLGVAASVVSVDHAKTGLGLAIGGLVLLLLAPWLGARRATQWVWAGRTEGTVPIVRLLLTCRADAQPAPLAERWLARARLPGPRVLLGLALAGLVACAAVRTGGTGGTVLVALMRGVVPGRRGRSRSPAAVARAARWPAIALEGGADELVELTLGLVAALDRELAERQA